MVEAIVGCRDAAQVRHLQLIRWPRIAELAVMPLRWYGASADPDQDGECAIESLIWPDVAA